MDAWKQPTNHLTLSHLWLKKMMTENEAKGRKEQAFDTPFRYSDAGSCTRKLGYTNLGYEGEPFDAPATLVTWVGTTIHEKVQAAAIEAYMDAFTEEGKSQIEGLTSGHYDGILTTRFVGSSAEHRTLYELKTMGGTAFKKSIGFSNKGLGTPVGPRRSAVIQAALNALANDCDDILIGHISLEAISKQAAARMGLSEMERIIAEWRIPKEVWEPIAYEEMGRLQEALDDLHIDVLPDRHAVDDDGKVVTLDPDNSRWWQCSYCSYRDQCVQDGPGRPSIKESINAE